MSNPKASGSRKKRQGVQREPPPPIQPPQNVYRPTMFNPPPPIQPPQNYQQFYSQPPQQQFLPNFYQTNQFLDLNPFSPPPQFNPQQQFPSQVQHGLEDFDLEEEPAQETQEVQSDSPDDTEMVPETQPSTKKKANKGKFSTRADRQEWTPTQLVNLAKSWIYVSENPIVGDAQKREQFWLNILDHFHNLCGHTVNRTVHSLHTKWGTVNHAVAQFNGFYIQAVHLFVLII
jgi:hypothetical protein